MKRELQDGSGDNSDTIEWCLGLSGVRDVGDRSSYAREANQALWPFVLFLNVGRAKTSSRCSKIN